MSKIPERGKELRHNKFLSRITKTLYYGRLSKTDRLSLPVAELASELFSKAQKSHSLNRLYSDEAVTISRNTCVSPCSFVLALLYFERLKCCNPEYLQQIAPSKLFLISLMISSKFLHDDGEEDQVFMDEWAQSAEITVTELCQLEKEFLNAIEWNVFVSEPIFWSKLEQLETDLAMREGTKRGWFTYTELQYILDSCDVTNLLQTLVAICAVLAATYTVGVLTLVGSVYLTSLTPGTSLNNMQSNMLLPLKQKMEISTESENATRPLNVIHVLKTGLILASITCNNDLSDCESPELSTWDWWNHPIINWLTDISKVNGVESSGIKLPPNYYKNFAQDKLLDLSIAGQKKLQLEDKIHKATKIRIQEQMERSWHTEWIDSFSYLKQISA